VRFRTFFRFSDFFLRLAKNSETKIFIITARFFFFGLRKLRNSKLRREKKKNTVKTQRSIFVFWPIEASKYRCWRQDKRCDFRTFFRFSNFILRLAKNSQTKIFIVALGERKKNSVTCLELLGQTVVFLFLIPFFVTTPYLARAHVCRRFVSAHATPLKYKRRRAIH